MNPAPSFSARLGFALLLGSAAPLSAQQSLRTAPAAAAAPAAAPSAQPGAPSQLYLQGHLIMKQGTELEAKGDFAGAYFKLKDARDLFDAAGEADRTWQPEIVEYRRRKIREEMERVRVLEVKRRAAGGAVSASGVIGNASASNLTIEPALPAGTAPATPRNTPLVMEERLRGMQAQIDALTKKNEETFKKLGTRESELLAARGEIQSSRTAEKALRESLAKVQTDLDRAEPMAKRENKNLTKRVEQLEQQLAEAMTQLSTANAKSDSLLADLEKAYGEVKERTRERDELRKERDQFEALLTGGDNGKAPEKLKIIAENQRLKKELEAAQVTVAKLTAEKTTDQNEIATLRGQLQGMQEQVAKFQQESDDYRQQIVTLTERLDATNRMLGEKGEGAVNEVEASLENKVLREIILQQMKQQAKRESARRNVMEDLTKDGVLDSLKNLGVETDRVLRTLNEMAAGPDMSKEQRAVLSNTRLDQYLLNNGGPDLMMVQDSKALNGEGSSAAPNATPQGESKSKEQLAPELKAYANAAEELFVRNAFTEAENQYRKILLVEPMNVHALSNLGVVQVKQGNYEEAMKTIMKALAYDYDRSPVHYLLGVVHLRLNQPEEAAKEMKVALELDPTNSNAHLTLGRIAWNAKRRAEAEQHLKQAVALDPENAHAHFNLAVIYASDEKIDLARQHYRLALRHGAARDEKLDNLLGN